MTQARIKLAASLVGALLAVGGVGCAYSGSQRRTEHLTHELIQTHGTRTFNVSRAAAMFATAAALRAAGYDVAIENPDRGLLKTGRKRMSTTAQSTSSTNLWTGRSSRSSARAVDETTQFVARFSDAPGGGTTIRLEPKRYYGETDITESQPFWQGFLQDQWRRLFSDIEDALPVEPSPDLGDTT